MTTTHDVIVLGTGAAGLVAALAAHDGGAEVGVYERAPFVGGTTAVSGGIIWLPLNTKPGGADDRADALAYLASLSHGLIDPDRAAVFVDTGPEMITWLEAATPVRLRLVKGYPDYHPEHPGGRPTGGRSLECDLFSFHELGDWAAKVLPRDVPVPMLLAETPLGGATSAPRPELLQERRARDERGMGQGLVGALLKGCLDRGIEPVTDARALHLVIEDDRVTGVRFEDGTEVAARRGVIIATGGFEWDPAMVASFLRGPMTSPASPPWNTGDGHRMVMRVGASLGMMSEAWWVPVIETGDEVFGAPRRQLVLLERTRPGSIMVNREGKRFTNEAANYNALGGAFHQFDPSRFDYANLPCWLVFDHAYKLKYAVASAPAGEQVPAWMTTATTLDELARTIGVAPEGLVATVERFNAHAREGNDSDFGRGNSAYDTWNGDRTLPGWRATLGPLDEGPFYAVEIRSGSLGTKGGAQTDADGRVLDVDGEAIAGLFAAGNAMAAVTGMVYGGAGGTLGPAMVAGYRAGRAVAH